MRLARLMSDGTMAKTAILPVDLLSTLGVALACRPWLKEANLAGSPNGGGRGWTTFAVDIGETSLINTILQAPPTAGYI